MLAAFRLNPVPTARQGTALHCSMNLRQCNITQLASLDSDSEILIVIMRSPGSRIYKIMWYLQSKRNRSNMASPKCSLPSCENEISGTAHVISLSPSESEVLFYRLGIDMKYLCNPHYKDQFTKYISWHNKKCSDPCHSHTKPKITRLGVISLETARSIKQNTE